MGDQRERKVKLDQRDTHPLPVNMRGDGQERRVRNASPLLSAPLPLVSRGGSRPRGMDRGVLGNMKVSRNYQDFQNGDRRALNHAWAPRDHPGPHHP